MVKWKKGLNRRPPTQSMAWLRWAGSGSLGSELPIPPALLAGCSSFPEPGEETAKLPLPGRRKCVLSESSHGNAAAGRCSEGNY